MLESKIYIIILNYKGHIDTVECLESCLKLEHTNFEIILVDNSPTNKSIDYILEWAAGKVDSIKTAFSDILTPLSKKPIEINFITEDEVNNITTISRDQKITLIKAKNNEGFAAGNNIGVKYAQKKGDYDFIWFLNNDTVVHKKSLLNLVNCANDHSKNKIGITGSTLLYYSDPEKIQALGGLFNPWFATSKHLADGVHIRELKRINTTKIDYVIGAAMLVSRKFLEDVGLMYEGYFLYYEEIDWIKRGKKNGWEINVCKESFVYHKEGASIGTGKPHERSEFSDLLCLKNRITFTKRTSKSFLPSVYAGFIIVIFNRIRRKQFRLAMKVVKTIFGIHKVSNEN